MYIWMGVPSPCHGQNHMHMTPEPHHGKNGCWFHRRLIPYRRMDTSCHVNFLPLSRRDKPYLHGRASFLFRTVKIIRPQRGPYLSIPIHPHRPPPSRYSDRTILRPARTSTRPGRGTLFSRGRNRATFLQMRPSIIRPHDQNHTTATRGLFIYSNTPTTASAVSRERENCHLYCRNLNTPRRGNPRFLRKEPCKIFAAEALHLPQRNLP